MNPWTALLIGILIGWLIEYVIDWLFWRRKSATEKDVEELKAKLQATQDQVADLEAQLVTAQADYENLEVESAAKVVEVEEVAAATVEANKPKYESDDFKGSLQGRLAGLGIGAAAVGVAVAAGDESGAEEDLSAADATAVEEVDDTAVDLDSQSPDEAPEMEEAELPGQEGSAVAEGAEEIVELDDVDQQAPEPSVSDLDQDADITDAVQETAEAEGGTDFQAETADPADGESGDSSEGGQVS